MQNHFTSIIFVKIIVMENWRDHIAIKPGVRSGKPCIKGTRITVGDIYRMLANEMSFEEILSDFPELTKEDIQASMIFANEREQITQYVFVK